MLAADRRVPRSGRFGIEQRHSPSRRVGLRDQLRHHRELGRVLRDRERTIGPEPDAADDRPELLPQVTGPERESELGAGCASAHPDEPEVAHRGPPWLGIGLELTHLVTAAPRRPGVHGPDDAASRPPRPDSSRSVPLTRRSRHAETADGPFAPHPLEADPIRTAGATRPVTINDPFTNSFPIRQPRWVASGQVERTGRAAAASNAPRPTSERSDSGRMRILVTNDDGVESPGILALATVLHDAGHDVIVVAPTSERSGSSAAIGPLHRNTSIPVVEHAWETPSGVPVLAVDAPPATAVYGACLGGFGPGSRPRGLRREPGREHRSSRAALGHRRRGADGGGPRRPRARGEREGTRGVGLVRGRRVPVGHRGPLRPRRGAVGDRAVDPAPGPQPQRRRIDRSTRCSESAKRVLPPTARSGRRRPTTPAASCSSISRVNDIVPDPDTDLGVLIAGYCSVTPLPVLEQAPFDGVAESLLGQLPAARSSNRGITP